MLETREKQLRLWRELVLDYCSKTATHQLHPPSFPFFKNEAIGRQLSPEGVREVVDSLIANGQAEWEDSSRSALRILWKSAEALGQEIYSWAKAGELLGTVFSLYELTAGDEYTDTGNPAESSKPL